MNTVKTCTKCPNEINESTQVKYKRPNGTYGVRGYCKECSNKKSKQWVENNKERRREIANAYARRNSKAQIKYSYNRRRTDLKTFLGCLHQNIKRRCTDPNDKKSHIYYGLEFIGRQEFVNWAMGLEEVKELFDTWVNSGNDITLTPSPDRLESHIGYIPDNLEWVTHSENSRRGANSRHGNWS